MTTIIGLPGSLRKGSYNLMLLRAAAAAMPAGVSLEIATIRDIPLYDADLESEQGVPTPVQQLKDRIAAADGLLIATPEYNNSMPGVLKNAIDWLIGSGELEERVVAITASVLAPERGRQGLAALRQTLGAVRAMIVSDEPVTRGPGSEETIRDVLRRLVDGVREARQGSA